MYTKRVTHAKVKFIFIALLLIVLGEVIYLTSSLKEKSSLLNKNIDTYKSCDRFQSLGTKQQCWENLIENTLKSEGLDSAFNLVDHLYASEPQFASDCHGFTHLLGEKAYELFSQNQQFSVSPKASYCGWGFYHAFMQSLLLTTGDLNKAREFCDYVGKKSEPNELARLSCFHGIGHGLLEDVPNPVLRGDAQAIIKQPLEICAKLSNSDTEEYRCASGVFNVLAIYYQNPKANLKIQNNDPYQICNDQSKKPVKKSCYDQMNSLILSFSSGDLSSASKFAEKIADDEFAADAMHGIAGAYGQSRVAKVNYDDVVKTCRSVQPRLRDRCLEGFLLGMLEGGKPGEEYLEGEKYCDNRILGEGEKAKCLNNLVWYVKMTNPKKLSEVCNKLEGKYRQNCNTI